MESFDLQIWTHIRTTNRTLLVAQTAQVRASLLFRRCPTCDRGERCKDARFRKMPLRTVAAPRRLGSRRCGRLGSLRYSGLAALRDEVNGEEASRWPIVRKG